jgi:hypothetical protein
MIYWLLQETSSGPSALLSGGVVGAVVGLVGVVIGQYLTQRRHSQALQQTAELEAQRAHEAALEKYIEHLGRLLTEQQLRHAAADDHLRAVARAHTLAVLEGLDPDRKRVLLGFQEALFAGANLQEATALTQEQLEHASGDENTKMPEGLKVPKSWTQG